MTEAIKEEYFIDGFLIKHFGIWPIGVNKDDLFKEQKIFLVYLIGAIPSIEGWELNVNYQREIEDVNSSTKVDISEEDLDVAKLQGTDIEKLKRERLRQQKEKRISEINKKYGIKEENTETSKKYVKLRNPDSRETIMELLQGKGLIKDK